jgi:hypothetical protein
MCQSSLDILRKEYADEFNIRYNLLMAKISLAISIPKYAIKPFSSAIP